MASDFKIVCTDILWVEGNREGIIPRSFSPYTLLKYFKHTLALQKQIGNFAIDNNVDIIWTVNEAYLAGPLTAHYAKIPNCAQVFGMTAFRTPIVGELLAHFHRRYTQGLIPCQDLIASEIAKSGYPERQINVVYNGVDIKEITSSVTNTSPRDTTTKKIGMVAGLDPRKGHLLFIDAAKLVLEHYPNAVFYLIGSIVGNERYLTEIKERIGNLNKNIRLTGKVDNIYNYIDALDVHCIPSQIEALSVAGLEAMALQKPVVATNVGGNYIAVQDGVTGTLTAAGNAREMSEAIIALLASSDMARQFGSNGRQLVEQQFTLQQSSANLYDIFIKHTTR